MLYGAGAAPGGNLRMWKARYPNGNPALPQDGYCSDGTPIEGSASDVTALPQNVNVFCERAGAAELQLVATGTMPDADFAAQNFTVPCSTIPAAGPDPAGQNRLGVATQERSGSSYGPLLWQQTFTGGCALFAPVLCR